MGLPTDVHELVLSYCSIRDWKNISTISHDYNRLMLPFLFANVRFNASELVDRSELESKLHLLQHAEFLEIVSPAPASSSLSGHVKLEKGVFKALLTGLSEAHSLRSLRAQCKYIKLTDSHVTDVLKEIPELRELTLTSSEITSKGVGSLSHLSSLRYLNLGYSKNIDDGSLRSFFSLPALKSLTLCHCTNIRFLNTADIQIVSTELQELLLNGCSIVPEATVFISRLTGMPDFSQKAEFSLFNFTKKYMYLF